MKNLMTLNQVSTYREKLSLVQNDDGKLAVYGGVVNITFPLCAAEIVLWRMDGKPITELKVAVYCQSSGDRLLTLNIDLTLEQAQQLHRAVPGLRFSDRLEDSAA